MDTADKYRLNKLKSLKVGDTVYLVPYDSRIKPCTKKIISLGNKWLKVDNMHRSENKFDVMDDYKHTPDLGSSGYILHASEEDCKRYHELNIEQEELMRQIYSLRIKSDNKVLKKVIKKWNRILNKTSLNKDNL